MRHFATSSPNNYNIFLINYINNYFPNNSKRLYVIQTNHQFRNVRHLNYNMEVEEAGAAVYQIQKLFNKSTIFEMKPIMNS